MRITRYLFLIFAVTSAYGGDGATNFLSTLQSLSLPEKIILPVIPLAVPIIATSYDYFARHYEPKTENELNRMLDNLRRAKEKLVEISSIKNQDKNIEKLKVMVVECNFEPVRSVETQILHISDVIKRIEKTTIKSEKDLYVVQYLCRTFSDRNCLFNVIQNAIDNIEGRLLNKKHYQAFDFETRLKYIYLESKGPKKMIPLWIFTCIGVALPLLYVHKKMKKIKIVGH